MLGRLFYWSFVLAIWGAIGAGGLFVYYGSQLPHIEQLAVPKRPPNIAVLGADGSLLANRGDTGGAAVRLQDLPPYLPKAFVAIEDRRFYSHWGVDPVGIFRAVFRNALGHGVVQGGSTLTQQLAKNLFLTQERTFSRKIQEAILALWLEHKYSKDQILELYLNRVYFGSGAYGVDAAAEKYFGHTAKAVTLPEAAMLAGLMKAPTKLAPNHNEAAAVERANQVIAAMAQEGHITEAMAKVALSHPAHAVRGKGGGSLNYAADYVMDMLDETIGAIDEDIVVTSTIDPVKQAAAERALTDVLAKQGGKYGVAQGALVSLDGTGAIRALVGGRDYEDSQFDRAISARRQPGSSFKPFVYLTALGRRPLKVGTLIDERTGVATELEQRSFLAGTFLHRPAHLGAAGEAQHLETFVGDELVAHGKRHRHDRNRTRGRAGFVDDLGHFEHGEWRVRRNLQDNGTAHRHRRCELVRRETHRQVERSDTRHETRRESTSKSETASRGFVDAEVEHFTTDALRLFGRHTKGESRPFDFGARITDRLAGLGAQQRGDQLGALSDEGRHPAQNRTALVGGLRAQCVLGRKSPFDGRFHHLARGLVGRADEVTVSGCAYFDDVAARHP